MGTSLKIFLVNEDDSLRALSRAQYERLLKGDDKECLIEYAGQRVRVVVAVLEMMRRKPVAISRVVYSYLQFDANGRIDIKERERETKMALEIVPPLDSQNTAGGIIDARHHFAKRRYEFKYRWQPSLEIKEALVEQIFGKEITPL